VDYEAQLASARSDGDRERIRREWEAEQVKVASALDEEKVRSLTSLLALNCLPSTVCPQLT
jgi:hypothetical protein